MSSLVSGLQNSLAPSTPRYRGFSTPRKYQITSTALEERDRKIGAAGELLVYELFNSLHPSLPYWDVSNWQSTIRHVTIHPDYTDLHPWTGRETSDFVYDDTEGALTALLIDSGYISSEEWWDSRPRYFIEVKTTTGSCEVPFYMSKNQYQRMRDVHGSGQNKAEVYLILRVSNLEDDDIGMAVYLDPEALRSSGKLLFTGGNWTVVPADAALSRR